MHTALHCIAADRKLMRYMEDGMQGFLVWAPFNDNPKVVSGFVYF